MVAQPLALIYSSFAHIFQASPFNLTGKYPDCSFSYILHLLLPPSRQHRRRCFICMSLPAFQPHLCSLFISSPTVISQLPTLPEPLAPYRCCIFPGILSYHFMHNALDIFLIYVYMKTDTYIIFCQFFIGARENFRNTHKKTNSENSASGVFRLICTFFGDELR